MKAARSKCCKTLKEVTLILKNTVLPKEEMRSKEGSSNVCLPSMTIDKSSLK